jgi:predicted CopG family antitoxin
MPTKNISITEDVYKKLLAEKHKGDSFSDVLRRLVSRRTLLSDSFGKWKVSASEAKKAKGELRKAWAKWESELS